MKRFRILSAVICVLFLVSGCAYYPAVSFPEAGNTGPHETEEEIIEETTEEEITLRIISTSDLHGRMLAYNYLQDREDTSGSLAQAASAIKEYRTDNTILVDVGDLAQDNFANIFLDEDVHPMMQGLNAIGYDVFTAGNHEFNFGCDFAKRLIDGCEGKYILGNVYDENGEPLADAYTIIEKDGVKIAFIGMVTPNILNWDKSNLTGYSVMDPADTINRILDEIADEADVFVGVFHMMEEDELETPHSGFASMAEACPRLDAILAAHGHTLVNAEYNGIPVTENNGYGKSMQVVDISVKDGEVTNIVTEAIETGEYPEDEELKELFAPYDQRAKDYASVKIAELKNSPLIEEGEINGVSRALTEDSAFLDFIEEVMIHYSGADVAATALFSADANIMPGDILRSDVCNIYKYDNTLYSVNMTGAQLKKYMEWAAAFYQQYEEGDLTIAFEDIPIYNYDTFAGVNYDIDISKPAGDRIVNLTWPSGEAVKDDDTLVLAVNNYRANAALTVPGVIYEEDDLPTVKESDIRSDIGDIRSMIADYLINECGGELIPKTDFNWRIIGNEWDEDLHKQAVDAINSGKLQLTEGSKGNPNIGKITVDDLK